MTTLIQRQLCQQHIDPFIPVAVRVYTGRPSQPVVHNTMLPWRGIYHCNPAVRIVVWPAIRSFFFFDIFQLYYSRARQEDEPPAITQCMGLWLPPKFFAFFADVSFPFRHFPATTSGSRDPIALLLSSSGGKKSAFECRKAPMSLT